MPANHNVTIELDIDDDVLLEMDAFPATTFDEEDDINIDSPIPISSVICKIPSEVKVRQLTPEIRDLIGINLNLPSSVTVGTWAQVADYLNSSHVPQLENDESYGEEMLSQFNDIPAQKLVDAIEKAKRVDILIKLKMIINTGNYFVKRTKAAAWQNIIDEKFSGTNLLLILHYEKTQLEKENFKWFLKNFRRNLRLYPVLAMMAPLDVAQLETDDGGNILKKLDEMFEEFPHIIVCFNDSYLTALYSTEDDENFRFRKMIHERTSIEFMNNGLKNRRCRSLIMPGCPKLRSTDWPGVIPSHKFPDGLKAFIDRLAELTNKTANKTENKTETNTT